MNNKYFFDKPVFGNNHFQQETQIDSGVYIDKYLWKKLFQSLLGKSIFHLKNTVDVQREPSLWKQATAMAVLIRYTSYNYLHH